jgi:hypothetical protein
MERLIMVQESLVVMTAISLLGLAAPELSLPTKIGPGVLISV